jgi:hypothetical protein
MQKCKTLPGIKTVELIRASLLDVYSPRPLQFSDGVLAYGVFTRLPITDHAASSVTSENLAGQTIYTTKTVFRIPDSTESHALCRQMIFFPFALRLTDVKGEQYLIGTQHKPHPTVAFNYINENSPAGKRIIEVTANWDNSFPLLHLTLPGLLY